MLVAGSGVELLCASAVFLWFYCLELDVKLFLCQERFLCLIRGVAGAGVWVLLFHRIISDNRLN